MGLSMDGPAAYLWALDCSESPLFAGRKIVRIA